MVSFPALLGLRFLAPTMHLLAALQHNPMAILDLGNYILELTLVEMSEDYYEYVLSLSCDGISVLAPWIKWKDGRPDGHLYIGANDSLDEALRPLLHEEWPVKWEDDEIGHWCKVIAYPSAFRHVLEDYERYSFNENEWVQMGAKAQDRINDRRDRNAPKRFHLERDHDYPFVRLDFSFGDWGMQLKRDLPVNFGGGGKLCFTAYVSYGLLEQFVDALKAEREALGAQPYAE